jgi:hypothetical protein
MRFAMPLLLFAVLLTGAAAPLSGPNNCGTPDEPKACPGGTHMSSGHAATHRPHKAPQAH